MAFIAAFLIWLVIWLVVNMALTGICIWAVNEIWNFDMPFWPVFALLMVLAAVTKGSSSTSTK